MLPVVAGAREARRQILIYTVLLLPVSLLPWWLGFAGEVYGLCAAIFGLIYLATSVAILFDRQRRERRQPDAGTGRRGSAFECRWSTCSRCSCRLALIVLSADGAVSATALAGAGC